LRCCSVGDDNENHEFGTPRSMSPYRLSPSPMSSENENESSPSSPPSNTPKRTTFSRNSGQKLGQAGKMLSNIGKKNLTAREKFEEINAKRIQNDERDLDIRNEQLKMQKKQYECDQRQKEEEVKLRRDQFEYEKVRDEKQHQLLMEKEETRRKELEIEELKLRLMLAQHATHN
jgi:hypothetical protein